MQVKKIMIKKVISVKPDIKVTEVAQLLTENRIHGLPVVKDQNIVGIITESDFFIKDLPNIYLPSYIDFLKTGKFAKSLPAKKKKEIKGLLEARAEDIMTKSCVTIREEADTSDLINIFKSKNLFTIPVVDKSGRLVGIITQADIIKLF